MTMRQLMSHTAGFGTSGSYEGQNITDRTQPLQAMIDKLAKLPLAIAAGHRLGVRSQRRHPGLRRREAVGPAAGRVPAHAIFEPLGMKDTGFWVDPVEARPRYQRAHL